MNSGTYCNCGKIPGSAEFGVIGVMGPAGLPWLSSCGAILPPVIIGDIIFCCKQHKIM